jgi:hypothetical protein
MDSLDSPVSGLLQEEKSGLHRLAMGVTLRYLSRMEQSTSSVLLNGMIWGGASLSVLGLFGLGWCVVTVFRARKAKLDDAAMRAVLQRVLPRNLGALFLSVIGLMFVIVGIFLK